MMLETEIVFRISAAFLFGALIGFERQWRHRTAGLRTNTLVSLGSALFVVLSIKITGDTSPSRIASQIVSGIGFLGAGVIMKEGFTVRGLNTAATLWCSAAVGSLCGMGLWEIALMGTSSVIAAHLIMRPIANYLNMRPSNPDYSTTDYTINIVCNKANENDLRLLIVELIKNSKFQLKTLKASPHQQDEYSEIIAGIFIYGKHSQSLENIMSSISANKNIVSVSWEVTDRNDD